MSEATFDFEDLFRSAPFAYLAVGEDGRIVLANATLSDWTGHPPADLVGMRFRDLMSVGTLMLYETSLAPLLTVHGRFDEGSLDLRTASGEMLAVTASARVATLPSGRPSTRVALHKATDRRRYERQLVDARDRSEETERATMSALQSEQAGSELREQFIAVLGHDLRNPLASISAASRLLQKDPTPERRQRLFEAIQDSVMRMNGLIDNVMDFARGRLGAGIPLELRPDVLLGPVLEQVVTELRIGNPTCVIATEIDLPDPIRSDPSRIGQLMSNLIGNALTHGSSDEPVRVYAAMADDVLTVRIVNGGAAIPDAALAQLFQPFFRGEVRPSQQGLGLGLHIASEIAKAHGGTLVATSRPDETVFTFRMPVSGGDTHVAETLQPGP